MRLLLSILILIFGVSAFAETSPDSFKDKYMYTSSFDPKLTEDNQVISKCAKVSPKVLEVLKSYTTCDFLPKGKSSPPTSIGSCARPDLAKAHFFDTLKECKAAQEDAVAGAVS